MTSRRNYQELIEDEFPELWDEDGVAGYDAWSKFGEFLDIELKGGDYYRLKKEIYEYLKRHPEVVSFLAL